MKHNGTTKRKYSILIADDDSAILDATSMILEDEGYKVRTSSDGKAVDDLTGELPDLLLLDIWMSGKDGREICRQVKNNLRTKHIPVIMISANRDTEKIAMEAGAEDFITKPFDIDVLLEKVQKHLRN
jgi:DNA-binding response OmpR family regulator